MKDIKKFSEEFYAAANKLIVAAKPIPRTVTVKDGVYHWDGKVVSADIYVKSDGKCFAEIKLLDSVKVVAADTPARLRDIAFWTDKCISRFLDDGILICLDDDTPTADDDDGYPF